MRGSGRSKLEEKFKIIPAAKLKTKKIKVNDKETETSTSGKLLGLNMTSTGFVGHIRKIINKGNGILSQLKRFSNLSPKIKTILVKTLLIPVMTCPSIPICTASQTQKREMQTILNKTLRFIHCYKQEPLTVFKLYIKYNIAPLNIANYYKAQNTWESIKISENIQYEELVTRNTHTWFPKKQ